MPIRHKHLKILSFDFVALRHRMDAPVFRPISMLFKRFAFLPALLLASTLAQAAPPLVTPAELQALLRAQTVRVVDVREAPAYALQHVPGAVSAPFGRWRAGGVNPGLPPTLDELTLLVQELGLTPEVRVVIVHPGNDAGDFGGAARAYWTLKSLGVRELSILNGGLAAWKQAGLAVSREPVKAEPSRWQPQFDARWLATRADVQASLAQAATLRVDARPAPFFLGRIAHDNALARGTLPGAMHLDSENFFELGSATLMDQPALAHEAEVLHATPGTPVITFCNAGHWSATDWFVLAELLGWPDVRMYPGSIIDWTRASARLPMANEPGRWDQLRYAALTWAHRNLGTRAP